jgi:hypothetical protein
VIGIGFLESLLYKGRSAQPQGLGRRTPKDWSHVEKYPLSALAASAVPTCVPVAIGVNWYSDFDAPEKFSGRWWIARNGIRGTIRGGHCICLKPTALTDPLTWWTWYDQGHEGACVGFGCSRMMSLLNRKRYFARWLWDHSKTIDEWSDTNPGDDNGTSVHAAMDVLRLNGHVAFSSKFNNLNVEGNGVYVTQRDLLSPNPLEGINAVRWATKVDEVRAVLQSALHDKLQAVPVLNSWGRDFPHAVWLPYTALQRIMDEEGEVAIVTDK